MRPSATDWNVEPVERLFEFARARGLSVRGHTLLWDQSTPPWARSRMRRGDWSIVADHFEGVIGRFGDRVVEWDVVNEPIGDDGALRSNVFARAYGPDYVARALTTAQSVSPGARLVINEYGLEYDNPVEAARREGLLSLVRSLRDRNVPLHAVGLQAHLDLGKGPLRAELIQPFLRDLAALDLDLVVTELDVREADLSLPLGERDRRVAAEVDRYLAIVLEEPAVKGVTTWGLSDRHSWLGQSNRGLPYCADMRPKVMHAALADRLSVRP